MSAQIPALPPNNNPMILPQAPPLSQSPIIVSGPVTTGLIAPSNSPEPALLTSALAGTLPEPDRLLLIGALIFLTLFFSYAWLFLDKSPAMVPALMCLGLLLGGQPAQLSARRAG